VTLNVPGTYTYTITNTNGASASVAAGTITTLTWTVVVTAPTLTSSAVVITTATAAGTAATTDSAATALVASGVAASTPVARIDVSQYMDADKTLLTAGYTKEVVVAITGAGAVSADGGAVRGTGVTQIAGTTTATVNGYSDYFLHSDGRTGKATITVTINGVLAATKTFTFLGTLATLFRQHQHSSLMLLLTM